MLRARTATDTAFLDKLTFPLIDLRDGRVYETALSIAGDRRASVPARVFAFRALVWTLEPGGMIDYVDLVDERRDDRHRRCNPAGAHLHWRPTLGAPIPADYEALIHRLAEATVQDTSAMRQIRRAAACARQPARPVSAR
jgi:hypothetical protein